MKQNFLKNLFFEILRAMSRVLFLQLHEVNPTTW